MSKNTFYITTPIFYPNAKLHMGHAYTTTVCDILARYNRLKGKETWLLTGADENTEKVVRAASAVNQPVSEYLDGIVNGFKDLYAKLDISYDQFIRTTDKEAHWPGAEEFWKRMAASGDIEKRSYEGLYCVGHESFITEKDLVDGKCPDHNEVPQHIKEENYFFKLSKYTDKIKKSIQSGELEIVPETRKNEITALLDRGLEDISFSRPAEKMTLGIPVPGDATQKIYVWGDALTNYVTAIGFGTDEKNFNKFWPASLHVIGKDILRFHAAIWPGMLMSAGLPLPKKLLVHGFITSGGMKMSKTLGNVVDPLQLIQEYGTDAVRYYLAHHISPFEDGDLTSESFKNAYNAHLANGLGNLTSRIMRLVQDHSVKVDVTHEAEISNSNIADAFDAFDIKSAIDSIWKAISNLDQRIQQEQPFKLVKEDKQKGVEMIASMGWELFKIAKLLEPFLPSTAATIQELVREGRSPEKPLFLRK